MLLGTDISTWEDKPDTPQEIDFVKMKQAGAEFCIFKVSQAKFTDRVFRISWPDCKGIMPRGGYHYLDWTKTGLEQAKYFCDAIAADPPEIQPEVDFEERKNVPVNAKDHLWNACEYIEQQTKRIPMIYTNPYYWIEHGSRDRAWLKFPLHIANYYVKNPMIPAPWVTWTFWQYTPKGDGIKYGSEALGIDLNWFNGTQEDFAKFIGIMMPAKTITERLTALELAARKAGWEV